MGIVGVGLGLVLGCDVEVAPGEDVSLRGDVDNGQVLNSAALNGVQFNGVQFNGSSFSGTLEGVPKSDVQFAGAEILLDVGGVVYTLRFDAIYKDPSRPTDDVYFYDISVRVGQDGEWTSLCTDPHGAPVAAIPLANFWNYTTGARVESSTVVTLACRGGALAKCVEWGYIPWHTAVDCSSGKCIAVSLQDHHQACTRMVRADYCGDGRTYTFDGTPIDIYDKLKVRIQSQSTKDVVGWSPEAEWSPNGATCVTNALRMAMYDSRGMPYTYPTCIDSLPPAPHCGDLNFKERPTSRVANSYCYLWTSDPTKCAAVYNDDAKKMKKK